MAQSPRFHSPRPSQRQLKLKAREIELTQRLRELAPYHYRTKGLQYNNHDFINCDFPEVRREVQYIKQELDDIKRHGIDAPYESLHETCGC